MRAALALCVAPLLLTASPADAQTKGKAKKDPCDPTYVPAKGETPPICPGVTDVPVQPTQGTASLAPTPPPVEPQPRIRRADPPPTKAIANSPGFRMMPDGSSKIFLQIHGSPSVKQIATRGGVTYVLSDCRVPMNNNRRPLMTQYFNTPIADARLRQFQGDVHLRIDLRATVAPTPRLVELVPGKVVLLEVTFPAGNYQQYIPGDGRRGRSRAGRGAPPPAPSGRAAPPRGQTNSVLGPPAP